MQDCWRVTAWPTRAGSAGRWPSSTPGWSPRLKQDSPDAAALIEACRGFEVGVISGEALINLKPRHLARLRALMEAVGGDQFRVIVYVRNLGDRMLSRLSQKAKLGAAYQETLGEWTGEEAIGKRLANLERVFGAEALDVRLMEAAPDLVDDFIARRGPAGARLRAARPQERLGRPAHLPAGQPAAGRVRPHRRGALRFPLGLRLPRLENAYLAAVAPMVAGAELDHPGLAAFREQLRTINWRDEAARPDLARVPRRPHHGAEDLEGRG